MMRNILALSFLFLFITLPAYSQSNLIEPDTTTYKKAKALIIPEIKFNDTLFSDAIAFLQKQSLVSDPDKNGLNFILKTSATPGTKEPLVTINLRNVPLSEALKYVADTAGYSVRYDENAIVLTPPEFLKRP